MTTLTQKPLSTLLDRLFIDADASEEALEREMEDIPPDERAAEGADYRQLYARLRDQPLPVSRATGALSLYAGPLHGRAKRRGVRNLLRDFNAPPGGGAQGQWRRAADRQRIRAVEGGARPREISRPPTCPIWSTFARAMRLRHSPATCLSRLTLFFWMGPRTSTRPFYPCWRTACASAR